MESSFSVLHAGVTSAQTAKFLLSLCYARIIIVSALIAVY